MPTKAFACIDSPSVSCFIYASYRGLSLYVPVKTRRSSRARNAEITHTRGKDPFPGLVRIVLQGLKHQKLTEVIRIGHIRLGEAAGV